MEKTETAERNSVQS